MTDVRKKSRWFKILVWLAGIIIVIRIAIPTVGIYMANKILPKYLNTDGHIGYFNAVFFRGMCSLGWISIDQPAGFDGDNAISLRKISVDVDLPSVWNEEPITIESIKINKLALNLVMDADGSFNLAQLVETSGDKQEESSGEPMAIIVKKLNVKNLSVSYRDLTYSPPLELQVDKCNITLTNLVFDPSRDNCKELVSSCVLTAVLKQPDGQPDAYIGAIARAGVLGTNFPAIVGAVRICGVELAPINMIINKAAQQALGGNNMDDYIDIAIAPDLLDCHAKVKTKSNTLHFALVGTPDKPVIKRSTALLNLATRPEALVGGVVKNIGSAGVSAVKGAGNTVLAAGKGGAKAVGKVGTGFFKAVKHTATLNFKKAGAGLKEGTIGAASEAVGAVGDTAGAAVSTVSDTASAGVGIAKTDEWLANSKPRWDELWKEAVNQVNAAPYPAPKKKSK